MAERILPSLLVPSAAAAAATTIISATPIELAPTEEYGSIDDRVKYNPILIEWIRGFQSFLFYGILAKLFPDLNERLQYVQPWAMKEWEEAFIHESVNINKNYETKETIGDSVLKGAFHTYILRLHPKMEITPQILTNYSSKYMSENNQRELAHMYGFDNWLRIDENMVPDTSDVEDIFESFCGALYLISERIKLGSGQYNVYRFLEIVLANFVDIKTIPRWGDNITQVKEIYDNLKWSSTAARKGEKAYYIYERVPISDLTKEQLEELGIRDKRWITHAHRYRLILTNEARKWIEVQNREMLGNPDFHMNNLIQESLEGTRMNTGEKIYYYAESVGLTMTIAEAKAFKLGLEALRRNGISREWTESFSRKKSMIRDYYGGLELQAFDIWSRWLATRGLEGDDVVIEKVDIKASKKKKGSDGGNGIYHLIGRDSTGKKYLLGKIVMPSGKGKEYELEIQRELLRRYVEGKGNNTVFS